MDDRAASKPRSLTPDDRPGKKARLESPPRSSPPHAEKTMAPESSEMNQDIPVDPVDSLGAPAVVTGGGGGGSSTSRAAGGGTKKQAKKKKKMQRLPEPCSPEDVLAKDVTLLLGQEAVDKAVEEGTEWESPFGMREEVELEITMLASNGEGLAIAPAPKRPWVVMVPFALPGEKVRARVYRSSRLHSVADLLGVEQPNPEMRDMSLVQCKYFGSCAGCQYQMLPYEKQLDLKRNVVVKAYQNFADLPSSALPPILDTLGSPLQYGYRTKITPHFEAAPKKLQGKSSDGLQPDWLKIGFNQIGTRHTMDIEECPIATPVINEALRPMREDIIKKAYSYKKGVSLLLRDSLELPQTPAITSKKVDRAPTPPALPAPSTSEPETHICVTDHRATVRERVGDMYFDYPGGSFFQNNNSVLVPLTTYVRDAIFPPASPASSTDAAPAPTHLVDAYCGSGLFSLTLSPHFETVAGIELSADSIRSATHNAALNRARVPPGRCSFRAGDAADIFSVVGDFPRARTALIIDPPRKGCDANFVGQLVQFACATVVYVSCNVHTQARDVGMILRKMEADGGGRRYVVESLRGFDLFPQTAHVESVAVLRLV